MSDARLVGTNPETSETVPVAVNAKGQMIVADVVIQDIPNDINVEGDLTVSGSGTFAGKVDVGDIFDAGGGTRVNADGTMLISPNASTPDDTTEVFKISSDNFATSDGSVVFLKNGNASFTGNVQSGGNVAAQESGVIINSKGYITASCTVGGVFAAYTSGEVTPTLLLKADGSVQFAGNKAGFTADGYLWCTTRRGDTVVLDATSSGLATWADYTPPIGRDFLEEKTDQLNNEPETEPKNQET